jgi:hypothetical protein
LHQKPLTSRFFKAGNAVELDFENVTVLASPFLNAAIGRLLKDIKPSNLNRLLKITNLVPTGLAVLRRVIENSKDIIPTPMYERR